MPIKRYMPADTNVAFIFEKAGVTDHFGWDPDPDNPDRIILGFHVQDQDAVDAAINSYPADYAEVEKPRMIEMVTNERARRVKEFTFGPFQLELDYITEGRITGATVWLTRNEDRQFINWDVGGGNFVKIDRDTMLALGDATGAHVQACFDHSESLVQQIRNAPDITALRDIQITEGWP